MILHILKYLNLYMCKTPPPTPWEPRLSIVCNGMSFDISLIGDVWRLRCDPNSDCEPEQSAALLI